MDVIAEVVVCNGTDVGGKTAGASTSCDLNKTGDEICELVRDERGDEEEEDTGCDDTAANRRGAEGWRAGAAFVGLAKEGRFRRDEAKGSGAYVDDKKGDVVHGYAEADADDTHERDEEPKKGIARAEKEFVLLEVDDWDCAVVVPCLAVF